MKQQEFIQDKWSIRTRGTAEPEDRGWVSNEEGRKGFYLPYEEDELNVRIAVPGYWM